MFDRAVAYLATLRIKNLAGKRPIDALRQHAVDSRWRAATLRRHEQRLYDPNIEVPAKIQTVTNASQPKPRKPRKPRVKHKKVVPVTVNHSSAPAKVDTVATIGPVSREQSVPSSALETAKGLKGEGFDISAATSDSVFLMSNCDTHNIGMSDMETSEDQVQVGLGKQGCEKFKCVLSKTRAAGCAAVLLLRKDLKRSVNEARAAARRALLEAHEDSVKKLSDMESSVHRLAGEVLRKVSAEKAAQEKAAALQAVANKSAFALELAMWQALPGELPISDKAQIEYKAAKSAAKQGWQIARTFEQTAMEAVQHAEEAASRNCQRLLQQTQETYRRAFADADCQVRAAAEKAEVAINAAKKEAKKGLKAANRILQDEVQQSNILFAATCRESGAAALRMQRNVAKAVFKVKEIMEKFTMKVLTAGDSATRILDAAGCRLMHVLLEALQARTAVLSSAPTAWQSPNELDSVLNQEMQKVRELLKDGLHHVDEEMRQAVLEGNAAAECTAHNVLTDIRQALAAGVLDIKRSADDAKREVREAMDAADTAQQDYQRYLTASVKAVKKSEVVGWRAMLLPGDVDAARDLRAFKRSAEFSADEAWNNVIIARLQATKTAELASESARGRTGELLEKAREAITMTAENASKINLSVEQTELKVSAAVQLTERDVQKAVEELMEMALGSTGQEEDRAASTAAVKIAGTNITAWFAEVAGRAVQTVRENVNSKLQLVNEEKCSALNELDAFAEQTISQIDHMVETQAAEDVAARGAAEEISVTAAVELAHSILAAALAHPRLDGVAGKAVTALLPLLGPMPQQNSTVPDEFYCPINMARTCAVPASCLCKLFVI